MDIANPIYDVVFRYLMDDNRIAKKIISAIIDMEVVSLEFKATERSALLLKEPLTVYRLDFAATVMTEEGEQKKILIEVQKAKFAQDIVRFRRYLGEEYRNKDNFIKTETSNKINVTPIPILTIYFLGYRLEHTKVPVIKVNRSYMDAVTGDVIIEKEDFIEGLTHDSYVIQIPYLEKNRQSKLLTLLSIFDQGNQTREGSGHILRIDENDFSEEYREVIRRLQRAVAEPEVRDRMDVEDEVVEELKDKDRMIQKERAAKEEAQEREKEAQEREKEAQEREKAALEEVERLKKKYGEK